MDIDKLDEREASSNSYVEGKRKKTYDTWLRGRFSRKPRNSLKDPE